jgi:long-chain acyl-CoA synthetase
MPYVNESIVIDKDSKLVALIHPDFDNAQKQNIQNEELRKIMEQNIKQLNTELPAYSRITDLQIFTEEFEKTPKRSIKRYLYQH